MKVLLNQDVAALGQIGEIVDVTDGYARNYLLPTGRASTPTAGNVKKIEAERARIEAVRIKLRQAMEAMAAKLAGKEITLTRMANEVGHLYGSVSGKDIAEALAAEGLPVQPSEVLIKEPIRTLDKYPIDIRLANDLTATVVLWIVPEKNAIPPEGAVAIGPEPKAKAEAPAGEENA